MREAAAQRSERIEALYPRLAPRLEALVRRSVSAPRDLIEDACQVAWGQLHSHAHEVLPGCELGWLGTTARREALRMVRSRIHEDSLPEEDVSEAVVAMVPTSDGLESLVELRERLAGVGVLPVRQQRMVWLQAVGYDYDEIATQTGDTERTVQRQLKRARQRLTAA